MLKFNCFRAVQALTEWVACTRFAFVGPCHPCRANNIAPPDPRTAFNVGRCRPTMEPVIWGGPDREAKMLVEWLLQRESNVGRFGQPRLWPFGNNPRIFWQLALTGLPSDQDNFLSW